MHCLLLLCLISIPFNIVAQEYDYGKPSELRDLKRVFVDTNGDIKNRDRISKEIQNAKLGVELLDSADNAEIILLFQAGKDRKTVGVFNPRGGSIAQPTYLTGQGYVLIPTKGKPRILMSFEDTQQTIFEKKPGTNYAREFIKAYKKANDLK